ncbi:unnamed protein product, partial [Phaeothamnion confervicola]
MERAVTQFQEYQPDVLVLAFNTLAKADQYYLGLYRRSGDASICDHRSIVLCGKDDVATAYKRCIEGHFDDYALFWPMAQDAFRLPMAIRHALSERDRSRTTLSASGELISAARRLPQLEQSLIEQCVDGRQHAEYALARVLYEEQRLAATLNGVTDQVTVSERT